MKPGLRKALLNANHVVALVFTVGFGFWWIYQVVDFFGTLNHLWVGNRYSVAAAALLNRGADYVGRQFSVYAAPVLKAAGLEFYAAWVAAFHWVGLSHRVADIVLASIVLVLDLALVVACFVWGSRSLRRQREQRRARRRTQPQG